MDGSQGQSLNWEKKNNSRKLHTLKLTASVPKIKGRVGGNCDPVDDHQEGRDRGKCDQVDDHPYSECGGGYISIHGLEFQKPAYTGMHRKTEEI